MVKLFRSKAKDDGAELNVEGGAAKQSRLKKIWTRKGKGGVPDEESNGLVDQSDSESGSTWFVTSPSDRHEIESVPSFGLKGKIQKHTRFAVEDNENIAVMYNDFGETASNVLNLVLRNEDPMPINPTDVIVKVEASTVSLQDCIIRRGMWYERVSLPQTPGFDVVGTIYDLGDKVKEEGEFELGDRVAALVRTGGNARFINIPSSSLVKVPREVNSAQAAAVVNTYMTAFQSLDTARGNRENTEEQLKGKKVLVTGGSGTVGKAIIQLARFAGADSIYATAYEKDHESVQALGAIALPFSNEKWLPKVKGHMDIVIDGICLDSLQSPKAALNDNGRLVCIGMTSLLYSTETGVLGMPASARWAAVKANCFMSRTTTFDLWESFQSEPEVFKSDLSFLLGLVQRGALKPTVSKTIPLSEVSEAQENLESGKISGQIVCKPWKRFVYRPANNDNDIVSASEVRE